MGWKPVLLWIPPVVLRELSENQCGMETHRLVCFLNGFLVVEREPMWDGNMANSSASAQYFLVEREPMWDGNFEGLERICSIQAVEREPMWDGNLYI